MTLSNSDRETIIRSSIELAKASGVVLGLQSWGIGWHKTKKRFEPVKGCCCPLGCVVLERQKVYLFQAEWRNWLVQDALQVDQHWVDSFIRSWDGVEKSQYDDDGAFELANTLRSEFVKIS